MSKESGIALFYLTSIQPERALPLKTGIGDPRRRDEDSYSKKFVILSSSTSLQLCESTQIEERNWGISEKTREMRMNQINWRMVLFNISSALKEHSNWVKELQKLREDDQRCRRGEDSYSKIQRIYSTVLFKMSSALDVENLEDGDNPQGVHFAVATHYANTSCDRSKRPDDNQPVFNIKTVSPAASGHSGQGDWLRAQRCGAVTRSSPVVPTQSRPASTAITVPCHVTTVATLVSISLQRWSLSSG